MYAAEEILLVDREDSGLLDGPDGGGPDLFLKQGHLTKELVPPHGAQAQLPSVCLGQGLDLTFLDDEHAIARLALLNDDLACLVLFP